ncbi:MAG TPA: putative Ig domain-containing protein, partial [Chryseolinea sp.]|nr:putative Ig domain-containing protein [Chryseolinea sp.]
LTIDGNLFQASVGAANFSFTTNGTSFANQAVPLIPATDANRATMIRSSIYGGSVTLAIGAIPSGSYQVWLYVWEDNFTETFSISLEGAVVQSNIISGSAGRWQKLGPYTRAITDGTINIAASGGHANLSGVEIWSVVAGGGNQSPVVANAIPDQTTTEGTAFTYTFPANTFSDPNAGTVFTYSASLSTGALLPAWLSFNTSTRTFSGTPGSTAVGPLNVRVTASDGAGASVNDTFLITVNPATPVTPLITWATPSPIPVGTALSSAQLNATATHNGSPVAGTFVYTPSSGTVLPLGNGQQLSVAFTPSNNVLYTTANKTVTINVVPVSLVTPLITWATPASITVGTALSGTQLNATASYNGTPVAGTFVYTPPSGTVLALGNAQQLSVAFTPSNSLTYTSANGSVLINVVSAPARVFYRALNLNGVALTIDGNLFQASVGAANFSYTTNGTTFANQAVPLIPTTDANRATMIRSSIYGGSVTLAISAVPAGNYEVWLYVWEDNFAETFSISVEGTLAQANINSGNAGVWRKLGPYARTVNDGTINIAANGGHANLSGVEIWRVNQQAGARIAEVEETELLVEESNTESLKLTAYPNPSSGKVNISFMVSEPSPTQLAMYDLRGIRILMLYEGSIQPGKNEEIEIEVDIPDGVYVLQLVNGHHVKHFKLGMAR